MYPADETPGRDDMLAENAISTPTPTRTATNATNNGLRFTCIRTRFANRVLQSPPTASAGSPGTLLLNAVSQGDVFYLDSPVPAAGR